MENTTQTECFRLNDYLHSNQSIILADHRSLKIRIQSNKTKINSIIVDFVVNRFITKCCVKQTKFLTNVDCTSTLNYIPSSLLVNGTVCFQKRFNSLCKRFHILKYPRTLDYNCFHRS